MTSDTDWMVSVDDHLLEPPTLWVDRLPVKYRDAAPHLERIDGVDKWIYDGKAVPTPGTVATVGHPDFSGASINYDEMHPACWQPLERVKCMDEAGILVQTNFPNYPRFCGQTFMEASDKDLALLCVQAWNDFMIDEWCAAAPGRFIPMAMIPMWDAKLAAREAERAISKGARAIIFSENPATLGLPSIHDKDDYWDPVFSLANETGLPITIHIGSSSKFPTTADDAPSMVSFSLTVMNSFATLCDWMFSGQFLRYDNLKIVLSEGEIGWMPFAKMWMDRSSLVHRWARRKDFNFDMKNGNFELKDLTRQIIDPDRPPSVLFKDHVYGCFIDDEIGMKNVDLIGIDNILMESDFPHSDGSWPNSIKIAKEQVAHLPADDQIKLLRSNACRVFQFAPAAPPLLSY